MARMDTNTLFSVLEIPLVVLSPVQHSTTETTRNVLVPVMRTMRVAPGLGFLFPPLTTAEERVISREDRKHESRRAEMA